MLIRRRFPPILSEIEGSASASDGTTTAGTTAPESTTPGSETPTDASASDTAGDPGQLTMWRTLYHGSTPDGSGKVQMFSLPVAGQSTAVINYVFAGLFNKNAWPDIAGEFFLDEFVFTR